MGPDPLETLFELAMSWNKLHRLACQEVGYVGTWERAAWSLHKIQDAGSATHPRLRPFDFLQYMKDSGNLHRWLGGRQVSAKISGKPMRNAIPF